MTMSLVDCHKEATNDKPPVTSQFRGAGCNGGVSQVKFQAAPMMKAPEGPDVRGNAPYRTHGM